MKAILSILIATLMSCSTVNTPEKIAEATSYDKESPLDRSIASIKTKIRFFETYIQNNEFPKKLECSRTRECRYLEIEISNDYLNVRACKISEHKLYWKTSAEKALIKEDLDSKCKNLLTDYDITPEVIDSLKNQMLKDRVQGRDPVELTRLGGATLVSALTTVINGVITVASAIDPVIPLFVITGPGTIAAGNATYISGKDFISEAKGKAKIIYKSGSNQQITNAIENNGVSSFLIASQNPSFMRSILEDAALSSNGYDRFQKAWKDYSKYLKSLQKGR